MRPPRFVDHYSREEIQANPDTLYVFGDNIERRGRGGQAAACRGEPNCIGIPTKWAPSNDLWAFLCDADFDIWCKESRDDFLRLTMAMEGGLHTVVWPSRGIGTGLADLKHHAPKIWAELQSRIKKLQTALA